MHFVANSRSAGTGRVLNVSLTGAYLETLVPLRLLSVIHLELDTPTSHAGSARTVSGTVVRRDGRGVGLEWLDENRGFVDIFQMSAVNVATPVVHLRLTP